MAKTYGVASDVGLLALRATVGGLLAGHGAQKLFGSFGGSGLKGTAGWLESMGLDPGRPWAMAAGGSELAGGVLTALGLLHPIGPVMSIGPMAMAWAKVHAGKPIWVTSGGAELPLLNIAAAVALALTGPGRISMDKIFRVKASPMLVIAGMAGVAAGVAAGVMAEPAPAPEDARSESLDGPAGGEPSSRLTNPSDQPPAFGIAMTVIGAGAEPFADDDVFLDDEELRMNEAGAMGYGGLGRDLPPDLPELAKEVGADPPGAFPGWNAPTSGPNPSPADDFDDGESDPRD